jgi:hypothetical protein
MTTNLTERRKADRNQMIAGVQCLLDRLGVEYRRNEKELAGMCPRRVSLELTLPRGLQLTVDFDGDSPQPDVHVLSWHVSTTSSACLSDVFQSVNEYHWQKATDIAHGFERLLALLESRIRAAQDGSAFSVEREDDYRRRYQEGRLPWQQVSKVSEVGRASRTDEESEAASAN